MKRSRFAREESVTPTATSMALRLIAAGMLAALVPAGVADAIHPRPRSASPILTSLVPAFEQCTAPDRTHGPPLAFPACSSPGQSSGYVTVGTPDANGAAPGFAGSVRTHSVPCSPGPPDDCEVKAIVSISDVRCTAAGSACGPANAAAGADYTGELQVDATYRMTDHFNAVAAGGGPDPATVVDITFPVSVPCAASGSTAVGSTCSINTLWNAVVPGSVKDTKRAVVEAGQTQVFDGGPDGVAATTPNTLFAVQGVFVP